MARRSVKSDELVFDFSSPDLYNPVYYPHVKNDSEFFHLYGGAGSGKSRFAAQREIIKSFRPERRERKTLVIRKVAKTLKDSVYSELKALVFNWKLEDCFEILKSPLWMRNKMTGVEFLFSGLDDPEKVKSIRGVDRIWIEEATELQEFSELRQLRLRARGFEKIQITLTYNPTDENHWISKQIHDAKHPEHFILKTTYRDNVRMLAADPDYARYIESLAADDENYYRVYGLGEWGRVVEGLIYVEWGVADEFPQRIDASGKVVDDVHAYGLDFGFSNPTALVALHVQDALPKKNLIVQEVLYKGGLDAPALVKEMDALGVQKNRDIIADNARPEMILSLQDAGYRVIACEKGAGSVLTGINSVRKYNLKVAAGSKEVIKEIRNYHKHQIKGIWKEEPAPNQADHAMDAVRYGEQGLHVSKWRQSTFRL